MKGGSSDRALPQGALHQPQHQAFKLLHRQAGGTECPLSTSPSSAPSAPSWATATGSERSWSEVDEGHQLHRTEGGWSKGQTLLYQTQGPAVRCSDQGRPAVMLFFS